MRKKLVSLFMTIAVIGMLFTGCGESPKDDKTGRKGEATVATDETTASGAKGEVGGSGEVVVGDESNSDFDTDAVAAGIEVKSYTYKRYGSYYLVLVLKNTIQDCTLNMTLDLLDKNGEIVGTEEAEVDAFAKDTEVALTFDSDEKFAKFTWEFEPEECDYYTPVTQNLKCEVRAAKEKAIISVTNNGNIAAQYVTYCALFFKGDKIVNTDWGYITDDDSEIKVGKTRKEEAHCYEKFDSVKVYLDGRGENDW